jgi:hypothetical protein
MYTIINTLIHRQRKNNLFVSSTTCFNHNGPSSGATELLMCKVYIYMYFEKQTIELQILQQCRLRSKEVMRHSSTIGTQQHKGRGIHVPKINTTMSLW